ncbi:MAG: GAF domain-containing sensor histidine kinase [bacterium]|nr:GAF domain-containing sensor histidine kinase [bacterium]
MNDEKTTFQMVTLTDQENFDEKTTDTLREIRNTVGIGLSLEAVMDVVWETTKTVLPHDRIGLSFIDTDGQRVTSLYFRTAYDESTVKLGKNYSAGLANSSLKNILDCGCARIINCLEKHLEHNPDSHSTRILLEEGVQASLTLPLKVENREVGFLFFSSKQRDAFLPLHAHILLAVSGIISQHIEKVWHMKLSEDSRLGYLSTLGFVSHEMKSPLASLITLGTTYTKGYMGEVDKVAGGTMTRMIKIAGYLINMVNNYLDLSRLESGEMAFNPKPGVNFRKEVLDFAIDTVTARAEERGSTIRVEQLTEDTEIAGDIDLLRIVAVNLVDNAVKYGDLAIEVVVTVSRENDRLVLSVRNKGVGFTKEQSKKLFRRFSRLKQKGTEDRKGTGLGLYLSWWIVQQHKGRISCQSEPGKWAEFTVTL